MGLLHAQDQDEMSFHDAHHLVNETLSESYLVIGDDETSFHKKQDNNIHKERVRLNNEIEGTEIGPSNPTSNMTLSDAIGIGQTILTQSGFSQIMNNLPIEN